MSREYIWQFVVQMPGETNRASELKKIKALFLDILKNLSFNSYLDSRTHTLSSVGFAVFTVISQQELSPLTLTNIANRIKDKYCCMFSIASANIDIHQGPAFSSTYKLGEGWEYNTD